MKEGRKKIRKEVRKEGSKEGRNMEGLERKEGMERKGKYK